MTTAELGSPLSDDRRGLTVAGSPVVDEIAALYPPVRRCDLLVTRAAHRRAPTFDARASATAWIVGAGLASHDPVEQERIVDGWHARQRHRGACIVVDGGCDVRIGCISIGPAARDALLHWLPLSLLELALFDGGLFADAPQESIALLVRPPTIWALEDARRAERRFPRGTDFQPDRFATLERYARNRVGDEQMTRLRAAALRIAPQLPVPGLPTASATVAAGCSLIAADDDCCAAVAARQLARYASSAVLARETSRECARKRGVPAAATVVNS
jgi:hypothetical protein